MSGPVNPNVCHKNAGRHDDRAIGHEHVNVGPVYESRGTNLVVTKPATRRYFVVRHCERCLGTWWDEYEPFVRGLIP